MYLVTHSRSATTWNSELFNIDQANAYANENQPDLIPSSSSSSGSSSSGGSSSSTNVGAIVGGPVGGLAGVLNLVFGGYTLYKRRQYMRIPTGPGTTPMVFRGASMGHARWPSDSFATFSQLGTTSSPLMPYTTSPRHGVSDLMPPLFSSLHAASPPRTGVTAFTTNANAAVPRDPDGLVSNLY
ncbi:hypothetical protein BS17DRAFT_271780 [Gyrodon lividus]|nr:hypothetical protein BS17DRAFT_271780 [Gyrodon lividus]